VQAAVKAVVMKSFSCALVISLAIRIAASYEYIGNCVPGGIVRGFNKTGGRIGLYTMALTTIMPIYGNLMLMAQGPSDQCNAAANAVNLNQVHPSKVLNHYIAMKQIGVLQSMKAADTKTSYLYVFKSKLFIEYSEIADCVPGPIVRGMNLTGGRIALYSMVLKTILPGIFGDLLFLGQGNTSACMDMMNKINEGNQTLKQMKNLSITLDMKEIGIMQGLNAAEDDKDYIYVFKNKMWNSTNGVMIPNMTSYGLAPDFVMKPANAPNAPNASKAPKAPKASQI